ncbi:uncharacterized protein LOC115227366 [Octopus sinensis]|uniref:Uncharacterized protein LOC115227366 n=1 Tax=Octopus sinensis TaxID=2607531 RepID=A0A6P7TVZ1_9MOLL|nr:uncharacterized protein LOC115227366 [Octopus sinensis]
MRVHIHDDTLATEFSKTLLYIGNGKLTQGPEDSRCHLPCGIMTASLEELKSKVFPNLATNYKSHKWLCERTIRAAMDDAVDKMNLSLLSQLPGAECSYRSVDSVPDQEQAMYYPVEFLNSLQPLEFPPHILIINAGAPIMLVRKLDGPRLCNGRRLVVKTFISHVLEAAMIASNMMWENVFIPSIDLCNIYQQDQALNVLGLNFLQPCFSHGHAKKNTQTTFNTSLLPSHNP